MLNHELPLSVRIQVNQSLSVIFSNWPASSAAFDAKIGRRCSEQMLGSEHVEAKRDSQTSFYKETNETQVGKVRFKRRFVL